MRAATEGQPPDEWPPPPPGAVEVKVNSHTGTLAGPDDPYAVREVFVSGTEPAPAPDETLEPPSQEQFYQQGQ